MPLAKDTRPEEEVSDNIIRQEFNNSQIIKRLENGEIITTKTRNTHKDPPPIGEPYCTRSQMVLYSEQNGEPIALVHQYLRPDGTIGASGMPDPKRLFLPDRILFVKSAKK